MKTSTTHPLTSIATAKVNSHCENPTLLNISIVILQESFGAEGVFYPAQDVTIYADGIAKLRDLLNSLPTV